jgi:hypothetical protein
LLQSLLGDEPRNSLIPSDLPYSTSEGSAMSEARKLAAILAADLAGPLRPRIYPMRPIGVAPWFAPAIPKRLYFIAIAIFVIFFVLALLAGEALFV